MELKPGYQQTDIGVLPKDWKVVPAGTIGKFRGGNGFPVKWQGEATGDYPFFKVSDMNNEGNAVFMETANHWISEKVRRQIGATVFPIGSIVMAKVGAAIFLERKKITSRPSCLDNNMTAYVLDENEADIRFVHMLLLYKEVGALVETTALPALSGRQLGQMLLPLPSLPEQHSIAEALGDVDGLLNELERLLAKKRDLRLAAMQQLLNAKTRLPGFQGKWEIKQLKDVLKVKHGKNQHSVAKSDGRFPILASGGEIGRTDTYLYNKPSVLIGRKGTIDAPQYADFPFWTVDTLFYTEIFQEANAKFIFYKFLMIEWAKYNEASGVPSLNAKTIESIEVELPPLPEQIAVAEVLSDMDAEIAEIEAQRDKTRDLQTAMMQQLLTGQTRLLTPAS